MPSNSGPRGLVTMVCITCGAEQFFDTAVPSSITCERCGSTVFRQFATPTEPDEATISQLEEQARSISYRRLRLTRFANWGMDSRPARQELVCSFSNSLPRLELPTSRLPASS
jgi:DNA-directed RNA polymerase subunit RPC12/RpoP